MATLDEISTENYFDAYDNIGVHSLMLRDKPRMEKYREAIMKSKNIFKEKVRIKRFFVFLTSIYIFSNWFIQEYRVYNIGQKKINK